jgi:hypothetical protein
MAEVPELRFEWALFPRRSIVFEFSGVSMSRILRHQRTLTARRFSLEWLEPRWLRDGSSATMASGASTYLNGVSWDATQNTLTIDFNLSGLDGYLAPSDVQLLPANPDYQMPTPSAQGYVDTPTDTLQTITYGSALAPGVYNIVLLDDMDTEGVWSMPSPSAPLGELTIAPPPVVNPPATLTKATSLGTIGSQMQSIAGSLDLSSFENVDLYSITLGPGHFWRLGVQLQAQQLGSPLQGALTLFDSSGKALATSNSGTGTFDSPADPYLFSGLNPGVYYIGVSGANNLGEQPGGYDPRGTGTFGTSGKQQAGGDYTLDLFADPADTPTRVTGSSLQWGDPLGTSPTGLVLDFSGSIDFNSLKAAANNQSAIWAADQSGHTWSLIPTSYNASLAQVSFVFDQPLPPGQYTLFNSPSVGFKDLAGWTPVASGLPQEALATWTVPRATAPAVPGNLGVLWPSQQNGVADSELILPGQVVTSQVFVPEPGWYALSTSVSQGMLGVERAGPDGMVVVDPGSQGASHQYRLPLETGVYDFTFRNLGMQEALAHWRIMLSAYDYDHLTDNGVGQSVAMSLRLINPTSSTLTTGSSPLPDSAGPVFGPAPLTETDTPAAPGSLTLALALPTLTGLSASSVSVSPIPNSLFVTVNSGLMGAPTAADTPVETVGSTAPTGMLALGNGASGRLSGIAGRWYGTAEDGNLAQSGQGPLANGLPAATADAAAPAADPSPASAGDAIALTKADRITELAGRLGRWFGLRIGDEGTTYDAAWADPDLLARNGTERGLRSSASPAGSGTEEMTEADLGMPTGLVVVAAAAFRLHQFAGRWWRRSRVQAQVTSRPEARQPGPRSRSFRGSQGTHAAATRVRAMHRC